MQESPITSRIPLPVTPRCARHVRCVRDSGDVVAVSLLDSPTVILHIARTMSTCARSTCRRVALAGLLLSPLLPWGDSRPKVRPRPKDSSRPEVRSSQDRMWRRPLRPPPSASRRYFATTTDRSSRCAPSSCRVSQRNAQPVRRFTSSDLVRGGTVGPVSTRPVMGATVVSVGGRDVFAITPLDIDPLAGETLDGKTAQAAANLQQALDEAAELKNPRRMLVSAGTGAPCHRCADVSAVARPSRVSGVVGPAPEPCRTQAPQAVGGRRAVGQGDTRFRVPAFSGDRHVCRL